MQYMGGKSRIAKHIVQAISEDTDRRSVWDPFCGGLSVSVAFAKAGYDVTSSDANAALITLYNAVRGGWDPPGTLSEAEYQRAKTLPDTDPLKAFAGIGCSFGGKWFGGYARQNSKHSFAGAARRRLIANTFALPYVMRLSFMDTPPKRLRGAENIIYCDPPYAGVTGYAAVGPFDHELFWATVQQWELHGVPVYVSEYACPLPHRVVWEKTYGRTMRAPGAATRTKHTDKLFSVEV